jgi:hypothetical protein
MLARSDCKPFHYLQLPGSRLAQGCFSSSHRNAGTYSTTIPTTTHFLQAKNK